MALIAKGPVRLIRQQWQNQEIRFVDIDPVIARGLWQTLVVVAVTARLAQLNADKWRHQGG